MFPYQIFTPVEFPASVGSDLSDRVYTNFVKRAQCALANRNLFVC